MTDLIDINKRYAYRHDPATEVRVLCVDGPSDAYPVISTVKERVVSHVAIGGQYNAGESGLDLVPYTPAPRVWWVNVYPSGNVYAYPDEMLATQCLSDLHEGETIRVREWPEDV